MFLFNSEMFGFDAQKDGVFHYLVNILKNNTPTLVPDAINGNVLTFNHGVKIQEFGKYALLINNVKHDVELTIIDENNVMFSGVDLDAKHSELCYRDMSGWVVEDETSDTVIFRSTLIKLIADKINKSFIVERSGKRIGFYLSDFYKEGRSWWEIIVFDNNLFLARDRGSGLSGLIAAVLLSNETMSICSTNSGNWYDFYINSPYSVIDESDLSVSTGVFNAVNGPVFASSSQFVKAVLLPAISRDTLFDGLSYIVGSIGTSGNRSVHRKQINENRWAFFYPIMDRETGAGMDFIK